MLRRSAWLSFVFLLACGGDDGPGDRCVVSSDTTCAMSGSANRPGTLTATTSGEGSARGSCGGGGPEAVFEFTAPFAGDFVFDTEGTSFDTVLYVRSGCGGDEIACNDDVRSGVLTSRLTLTLAACQTVLVYVDGFNPDHAGAVRLNVSSREMLCDDGTDDDGDGQIDCDDSDCALACGPAATWPPAWETFEDRALEETNRFRAMGASCDGEPFPPAPPLEPNDLLRISARLHSSDMGERAYFEHDNLDGLTPFDRMAAVGYEGASPWGENIAAGQSTPEEVVQGWMESPGHCRNIMNAQYRVLGMGYAFVEGSPYGHYWTQNFGGGH
ncbi:MAG: CAP domain-containing protein [Sandaracinus sp.]|nr:CAP domain-containing protein [Sandaracinus sp.]